MANYVATTWLKMLRQLGYRHLDNMAIDVYTTLLTTFHLLRQQRYDDLAAMLRQLGYRHLDNVAIDV